MKKRRGFEKIFVIWAICLMVLAALPVVLGTSGSYSDNSKDIKISGTNPADQFTNCFVVVYGKCNEVNGPLIWKFGLYAPLFKKSFTLKSSGGESEHLSVFVRSQQGLTFFKTYLSYENIQIDINSATGILFWGGKSILVNSTTLFCRCKADQVIVTAIN